MKKSTIFEVTSQSAGMLVNIMKDAEFRNDAVTVDYVKDQDFSERKDKKEHAFKGFMKENDGFKKRAKKEFKLSDKKKKKRS